MHCFLKPQQAVLFLLSFLNVGNPSTILEGTSVIVALQRLLMLQDDGISAIRQARLWKQPGISGTHAAMSEPKIHQALFIISLLLFCFVSLVVIELP